MMKKIKFRTREKEKEKNCSTIGTNVFSENGLLSSRENNVKWPNSALYGEGEPRRMIF